MIQLYDYQDACVAGVRSSLKRHRSVLLVSPTGSGKTVMFSYLVNAIVRAQKRAAILCHRNELVDQISEALAGFEVPHGLIVKESRAYDRMLLAHVASVLSLVRRLGITCVPDFAVLDEAHHALLKSAFGVVIAAWRVVNPKLRVIGVTATPERLDGAGLGETFEDMVQGPTTRELIAAGRLSPYRMYPPELPIDLGDTRKTATDFKKEDIEGFMDRPSITGDAVAHYMEHAPNTKFIARGISIAHSHHIVEQFRAAGVTAVHVDGDTPTIERKRIIRDFRDDQILGLCNVDLFGEGFDVPAVETFLDLCPTDSLAKAMQGWGRALRMFPGKKIAHLLDPAGNYWRHGEPKDDREWSLDAESREKRDKDPNAIKIKHCAQCGATNRGLAVSCRDCGYEWPQAALKPRVVGQRDGRLFELDDDVAQSRRDVLAMAEKSARQRAHIDAAIREKIRLRETLAEAAPELTPAEIRAMKPKQLKAEIAKRRDGEEWAA